MSFSAAGGSEWRARLRHLVDITFRTPPIVTARVREEPIRSELFSIERLEQHAESLAVAQRVSSKPEIGRRLDGRLRDNEIALRRAYHATVPSGGEGHSRNPAAEWLVDNFHLVEEQVREIRIDLPPGFHRRLPKLADGPLAGYPRVFGLAWAFVAHTDSHFDPDMLCRFVRAYQTVQPLTIGELWAVSITLRIVLVENLRRLAVDLVSSQEERRDANALADRLLGAGSHQAEPADTALRQLEGALPTAFAVQLVQRLRDQDPRVTPALVWLNERLAAQSTAAEDIVHEEQQRQGAVNVTIRNIITSLRLISAVDWRDLFENMSLVDEMLRAESAFAECDFPTRDLYRRAIEEFARGSSHSELDIARFALTAAGQAVDRPDPGYFLIGKGRAGFETSLGARLTFQRRLIRLNAKLGIVGYLSLVAIVAALIVLQALYRDAEGSGGWTPWLLAVLALIPASDAAVALVNYAVTNRFTASVLPGFELAGGIPSDLRTMIVVPTLLTSLDAVASQVEQLEVHHLANADGDLSFALLSDWTDSNTESAPGDGALLEAALAAIANLNRRYGAAPGGDRFLLLHRRRLWNEGQGKWMGWERKRGKLHEFNRLLRGASDTSFIATGGRPLAVAAGVRYVIILDADTRLPRGAAKRLVGKMIHPLNRARLDPESGRIVDGYAILQPRVTPSMPVGRLGSLFQRIFSNTSGLDPYASAVSDLYQDLFGEGSYVGKGIYDVALFEAALAGRIPENSLLSHDLLEGIFARTGLASDIEVIDEFPARYDGAAARQHRWARGDWQLLPWIFGRHSAGVRDRIPLIGRWKMIDNLRRSLSAPACFVALLGGWTLPGAMAGAWTGFVLITIAIPALIPLLTGIVPRRPGLSGRIHTRAVGIDFRLALSQIVLLTTFLTHQAWSMADAAVRTIYRLTISRRNLLEWVTAAQAKISPRLTLAGFYRQMAGGVALALGAAFLVAWVRPASAPFAGPIIVAWLLAPIVARWISLPTERTLLAPVSARETQALRLVARRTWRFFDTFVTTSENMLPPDNFQEDPAPVVAHRTSPTNLGLYLLSVIAARDFGWLGTVETAERLEVTLQTMSKLERFRGHFYNWYDTQDLRALDPKYISTVDSGNLAGHLVALWNACGEMGAAPVTGARWNEGIGDALDFLLDALPAVDGTSAAGDTLRNAVEAFAATLRAPAATPVEMAGRLIELAEQAERITALTRAQAGDTAEAVDWARAVEASVGSHRRDLDALMPWAGFLHCNPALVNRVKAEQSLHGLVGAMPSVEDLPGLCVAALAVLKRWNAAEPRPEFDVLTDHLERSGQAAIAFRSRISGLGDIAREMFNAMSFGFLFDPERELFSIGYRVVEEAHDPSLYDLLASEARLASFVAIAKGDIPTRHWFRLGRALAPVGYGAALISWSGSMFEYLMPSLVMRAPLGTLLEQTSREIVSQQMKYGARRGVPWGVSESAYNARDLEFTYQYSSFGLPDLGLKRRLAEDTVIAPYATGLATMVDPRAAADNFAALAAVGGRGRYGWYEAIDYTRTRLPEGSGLAVVRAYMAHHQGMSVIAIANALHDGEMRSRFHAEPMIQAAELLLQERMPRDVALSEPMIETADNATDSDEPAMATQRRFNSPHDITPRTHLLSNGSYAVMITAAGSGYSHWRDIAVTRWREDVTRDGWGSYIFLRDMAGGEAWSAGYQPSGTEPDRYEVAFSEGRAEIVRQDGSLTTTLEVTVSSEDDAEVRRVSITNLGDQTRTIEVTSYTEIVLAPQVADNAHPAFSKLFVETDFVSEFGVILATRRRRSPGEEPVWAAHLVVVEGETVGDLQFETDRARFLGRGHGIRAAVAMAPGGLLSGTTGSVLDPIFSLRRRVRVPPHATVRLAFWTLAASSRQEALDLVDKHHDPIAFDRAATLAWSQAQIQLRHLDIGPSEAHLFQRIANRVLYSDPTLRPGSDALTRGGGAASKLWSLGISGDTPIVLARIDDAGDLELVRQLLLAHEYWRMKQLAVDLVIINERPSSYIQDLQITIEALVRANRSSPRPVAAPVQGQIFTLRADLVPAELRSLLQTAARAVLVGHRGSLAEQVRRAIEPKMPASPPPRRSTILPPPVAPRLPSLEFFNGLGGFADDGREYVVTIDKGRSTPAPWINVVANPSFGFHASAEGSGCTWSLNSQQNHLTPWSNDPVCDTPGEAIYIRDDDDGELWGPTALPIHEEGTSYVARHGQGYSRFEHASHGIALELTQFVPVEDPIKISRIRITNRTGRSRRLSVTAYVEWVLGQTRGTGTPFIVTGIDPQSGAIVASNPLNADFGSRIAFADLAGRQASWTGDRTEFIGRNGALARPAALMSGRPLSNRVGAGIDPCGALQTRLTLEPNASAEIVFLLGETATQPDAQALLVKYRSADLDEVLAAVARQWDDTLGAVQVTTPDRSMDILLNRWLLYQTLACRVWARVAFYQASGAYGFRDQLQDVMALCTARPEVAREHLLRAASRQFVEGDAQHWWLPESGRGVRTRVSDDRLWLAFATAHYIDVTGDRGVLDETVPFLDGPVLRDDQGESFFQPTESERRATLFEHCALALDGSLALGRHGLPLMGTGDWNDGMNRVGEHGQGESIWLGWFAHASMSAFAPLAEGRDDARASRWRQHAADLVTALERDGWDGDWYRRAYFDDGTPLGSVMNAECRIDSIAQSWSVISGAGEPGHAARAMAAVNQHLVRGDDGMVLLFTPPFDQTPLDPGYIKGYPPGIRENGGQYTHGAVWSAIAFAMLGDGDEAGRLFSLLNPINHAITPEAAQRYKVEPYVACADIYASPHHVGRGGWTWYTGSAGWMYRAGLEWILGFRPRGTELHIDPCIPRAWPGFKITFRHHAARYEIAVENPKSVSRGVVLAELDGAVLPGPGARVPLVDAGEHRVRVVLG